MLFHPEQQKRELTPHRPPVVQNPPLPLIIADESLRIDPVSALSAISRDFFDRWYSDRILTTILTTKNDPKRSFLCLLDVIRETKKNPRSFKLQGFQRVAQIGLEPMTLRV